MQVYELMNQVVDEAPGADLRNFLALVREGVETIWSRFSWREALTTYDFSPTVQGTNGTVVNGVATIGHTGSDLFLDAHVGATITVLASDVSSVAQRFTITGVTDAREATLSGAWSLGTQNGNVVFTITQGAWPLPSGVRRVWCLYSGAHPGERYYHEPRDYRQFAAGGVETLHFVTPPGLGVELHLQYFREVTLPTGPASETGLSAALEKALWWYVLQRVFGRLGREDPERWDGPRRDAEKRFHVELGAAKTKDYRATAKVRRNRRMFLGEETARLRQ